jgi:hypothetical protein
MTESPPVAVKNTLAPLFEIEAFQNCPAFTPRSLDEIEQWLRTEQQFWQWTKSVTQVPDMGRQYHGENEAFSYLQAMRSNPDNPPHTSQQLINIRNILVQRYQQFKALHSTIPKSRFLATVENKAVAGHALRIFMDLPPSNIGDPACWRGSLVAAAWDLGLQGVPKSYEIEFSELRRKIDLEHEQLRRQAGASADEFAKLEIEVGKLHSEQGKFFDEQEAQRKISFESREKSHDKQMGDITKSYQETMAMRASVTYLKEGSKDRRKAWIATAIVTFLVGAAFAGAAFYVARQVLGSATPEWYKIAPAALLATLIFWLIRILVRMFLSNLHQSSDMRARATLIQTYLALLAEGNAVKEEDRKLILQVIFRPISDGLVKDDAAPGGPWDLITRLLAGGK